MPPMIKAGISNSPNPVSNYIDKRLSPFSTLVATTIKPPEIGREGESEKPSSTDKLATKKSTLKHKSSSSSSYVKKKEKLSTASSIPTVVSTEKPRVKVEGDGAPDTTSTSYEEDENHSVSSEVMIPLKEEEGNETFAYADEADSTTNDGYHGDANSNSISSSQRRRKPARMNGHESDRGRHQSNGHKRRSQSHKSLSSQAGTAVSEMSLAVRSHNVCKVIKGEIHNVLNIMRSDPRCASPLRFVEEMPTDEQHPLLLRFRELHRSMTEWELRHGYDGTSRQQLHQPEARLYLPPFCMAIQSRDISAKVTGAALQSLQKFLLFGFLSAEGPNAFATIANTLLLCTFEESSSLAANDSNASGTRGEPSIIGRLPAGRSGSNSSNEVTYAGRDDDEQVVLRLLDLSALIVRSASTELKPDVVVGLLDICLHVSHRAKRASGLLKSAASDAMKQIVLEVFSKPNLARKREEILAKLASLLNPKQNSDAYVVNSLTLVNFALETLTPERLTNVEIGILKKELCTYLLHWSTSHDLVILSLTMRIIFNLFQTIRNHLKVPLEVFLTSVHLRILEHSRNSEEREVALESLLEFCREPALIKDLYLNYDCDVQCTNLYANICTTLANVAAPLTYGTQEDIMNGDNSGSNNHAKRMNGGGSTIAQKAAIAASEVPMNILNVLALESLLTIIESIARRCKNHSQHQEEGGVNNITTNTNTNLASTTNKSSRFNYSSSGSVDLDDDLEMSEEDLQERKRRKAALSRVAAAFNKDQGSKDWIKIGKDSHVLEETPESVALALYTAPGLDKDQLGTYLGKGPVEKYPFIHEVRLAFVTHFDFSNCGRFASALRTFLHKFRLPGEAQQIDRLMDAFSKEYYKQQGKKSVFKNSDAVFVLAFSTIMLNTDLHNPNIKNKKKMTRQQFIRNNRGINKGSDLPEAMLAWLYTDIREHELQVQREIGEFISHSDALDAEHFRGAWGDMLRKNVAVAVFTSADEARKSMFEAGVHEKDMFLAICKPALRAISSAFVRSWDDGNIVCALKGLEQMAKISTFFALDDLLNEILSFLLAQGRDYIIGCVALEYSGIESGAPISQEIDDEDTMATMSIVDPDSPVPFPLLRVREIAYVDTKKTDINGAAAYRGLLALNMGLRIVRTLFPRVRGAWPQLIEVFGCLRDARALPAGLSDLDDFADSDGNVLPLSLFARNSQGRLDEIYSIKAGKKGNTKQGWFRGVFARASSTEDEGSGGIQTGPSSQWRTSKISENSKILLQVAEWTEVEKFMVLGPHLRLQLVQQSLKGLLQSIDIIPSKPSPTFEQHQAFALELATRALLNSDDRAQVLFPIFLSKFNSVAQKLSKLKRPIPVPFLMERVVVTILRSSIHLYHIPAMRQQLRTSLSLISAFPKPFMGHIADRSACGLAIIWRSSFSLFTAPKDLKLIGDMFNTLANFPLGRGLIFDGIASTIEFTLPSSSISNILEYEDKVRQKPTLTVPACATLQRILFMFMYGNYERDTSLAIPAMLCVEKLYKHGVQLLLIEQKNDPIHRDLELSSVPNLELWYGISIAFYTVCTNPDEKISKKGLETCQRHIFVSDMTEVPDSKWIALINNMIKKQPSTNSIMSRINSLSIIAQLMVKLFPSMTGKESNWKVLTELTKQVTMIADENLRNRSSPDVLFDLTVTIVTHLSVQLGSTKFGGDRRYCKWASDSFSKILEKNGAAKANNLLAKGSDADDGNGGKDDEQSTDESA